jgi:hypothetical protein
VGGLIPATFGLDIWALGHRIEERGSLTPVEGALAVDVVDSAGRLRRFNADVTTAGGGIPFAHTQGTTERIDMFSGSEGGFASGGVRYQVSVAAQNPLYPNLPVPVRVTGAGEASASLTSDFGGAMQGLAFVRFEGPFFRILQASAVADQMGEQANASFNDAFIVNLLPGNIVDITIGATGRAIPTSGGLVSGEFQAAADPIFEIDPLATFSFNGQEVRFADAYSMVYSDGIDPPPAVAAVPEPNSCLLLASGLLCLAIRRTTARGKGKDPSARR